MAIIDLDSHLRDGWLLDEIYKLPEPFANYSPKRIGDGKYFYAKFEFPITVKGLRERPDLSPKHKKMILEDNALELIRL
jgi:hypothetical protein